jgi:hypothetical protein
MIDLVIGSKVRTKAPPVNTFELVTTGMSGDGDYDEENSLFGDHDIIVKWIEILNAVSAMGWNARCGNDDGVYEVVRAKALEIGIEANIAEDTYSDMVGSDIFCDGQRAMLTGVEVFWYNANGEKFNVEVKGLIDPHD